MLLCLSPINNYRQLHSQIRNTIYGCSLQLAGKMSLTRHRAEFAGIVVTARAVVSASGVRRRRRHRLIASVSKINSRCVNIRLRKFIECIIVQLAEQCVTIPKREFIS